MTTVHASPDYAIRPQGDPPPGYPVQPVSDTFSTTPFASTYPERRLAYFKHVLRNPAPQNTKPVFYELVRLAAGGRPHEGIIQSALDFIEARKDCADFVLHGILRLLYQFGGPEDGFSPALLERARQTVLSFKYWPDEPGIDSMCTWTENHQILFASAAYLAGQHYPDSVFTNAGHTGTEKMALHRRRILRWLELRVLTGFSEWLSHVYYDEDLAALLSLVDFCEDKEIIQKSKMALDLLLLDMALNSFRGVFGSTHGRSYVNTKQWASNEGVTDTMKLVFGTGVFSGFDNMSAAAFALSQNYTPPPVLVAIVNDIDRPGMANRQRMGIRMDQAEYWGLELKDFEDGMIFLTMEAYTHPMTINLVMRMFDAYNWWENDFFAPFKPYRRLLRTARWLGLLRRLARRYERDITRNLREEVNTYTYRTPDYMLSCAQDYRPGYGGDQQHIWQATLGPDAVCFTTHPARLEGPTPNYWTGSGQLPRAAQVGSVVIAIYNIEPIPSLYVTDRLEFTHAWLPRDQFDEVIDVEGWVFARKGDGYLALRSMQPVHWRQPGEEITAGQKPAEQVRSDASHHPELNANRELIANGAQNIWICELGRRASDGEFTAFIDKICAAPLGFGELRVSYTSPSQGRLEFGWTGPLTQDGRALPLAEYPRYFNPYLQAGFPGEQITLRHAGHSLNLDWYRQKREVDGEPA